MGKYLELFKGEVGDLTEKTKLENKPYVAYSTKLGKVTYTVVPKLQPDNEIWYTTVDGSVANFNDNYCNTTLISNTYKNGLGVAKFKDPLIKIWGDMESKHEGEHFEVSYWGFAGGTRIETIFLPNKLETIDAYAFNYHYVGFPTRESADVEYLREITLGNNINTLDYSPNYGNSLQKTIYKGDVSDYCKINIISSPVSYSHNLYILIY